MKTKSKAAKAPAARREKKIRRLCEMSTADQFDAIIRRLPKPSVAECIDGVKEQIESYYTDGGGLTTHEVSALFEIHLLRETITYLRAIR